MALQIDEFLATGAEPGPGHGMLTGRYACYDTYEAGDGRWLTVAAIEPRFWANLCRALRLERWAGRQTDDEVQDEIRRDLRAVFATRTRDEWVATLGPADTCVAPVLTVPEVVADPQFRARAAFVDAAHARHGTFRQVGAVLAGTPSPTEPVEVRDGGVTDTDALLDAAGLTRDESAALQRAGAVA
jgi:alpha-methylacyl-CoA racemase